MQPRTLIPLLLGLVVATPAAAHPLTDAEFCGVGLTIALVPDLHVVHHLLSLLSAERQN